MKTNIKALIVGESGSGKTHFCGSFPKSYWICTEPDGLITLEMQPQLIKNVIKHEYYIPNPLESLKDTFKRMEDALTEAHHLYKNNEIETLIIDNATFLSENRWNYINKYDPLYGSNGELDTRSMYRKLADYLYDLFLYKVTSFPGNVACTAHVKLESDEAMKKKIDKKVNQAPDILGGFRNQCVGLFSTVLYLDKELKGGKYLYTAQTNKGNGRLAKNRYGLDPIIENISYDTIYKAIEKAKSLTTTNKGA